MEEESRRQKRIPLPPFCFSFLPAPSFSPSLARRHKRLEKAGGIGLDAWRTRRYPYPKRGKRRGRCCSRKSLRESHLLPDLFFLLRYFFKRQRRFVARICDIYCSVSTPNPTPIYALSFCKKKIKTRVRNCQSHFCFLSHPLAPFLVLFSVGFPYS